MFQKRMSSCLTTIVFLSDMWNCGLAQPSDSPDNQCTKSVLSLLSCEPFLAGNNVSVPPDNCCAGLNDLVRTSPTCLCGVISGNPNFSSINLTRALELPHSCGIPVDKSQCKAIGAPPPSPLSNSSAPGILAPPGSTGSKLLVPWLICGWALLGSIIVLTDPFLS